MATFRAVILKGKIHVRQDKTSNIKIRVTHKGRTEYISTDLYVNHKQFSKGMAKGENSEYLNDRILDVLSLYNKRYLRLGNDSRILNVKELRERITTDEDMQEIDFIKFSDDYIERMPRNGTRRILVATVNHLKKFSPELKFSDIDLVFLNDFNSYLKNNHVERARVNYMNTFRILFNHGRDQYNDESRGFIRIPQYPFRKFKIDKMPSQTNNNRLTVDQLKLLRDFEPRRKSVKRSRDMFMLMFYLIGINAKDLFHLQRPDKKGRVKYMRFKTGKEYSIKLEQEAQEIIDRYKGTTNLLNLNETYGHHDEFLHYINYDLKTICSGILTKLQEEDKNASFPLKVSTNWARHSWATIARNDCRITKDDVALCMGHEDKDNKVTDIYINYDYSIQDEANRKVLDYLE